MKSAGLVLLLIFPLSAKAVFLDCAFFDGFQAEIATAPAAWQGNLQVHNCARKTVIPAASPVIPLMTWANDLQATAQAYASQCNYAHSGAAGLGENIYAAAPFNATAQTDSAQDWASEQAVYDYAGNTCPVGQQCGHYTQMVWRSSLELGCGVANCTMNTPFDPVMFPNWTFVVCNYRPPGNNGNRPY
ncbi:MAG: CAP domain-containing protein [Dokdonella sp.]